MVKAIIEQINPFVNFLIENEGSSFEINIKGNIVNISSNIINTVSTRYEEYLLIEENDLSYFIKLSSIDSIKCHKS